MCSYAAAIRNCVLPAMVGKLVNLKKREGPLSSTEEKEVAYEAKTFALVRLHLHGLSAVLAAAQGSIPLAAAEAAVTTARNMAMIATLGTSDATQELGRLAGEWTEITLRYSSALNEYFRALASFQAACREMALAAGVACAPKMKEALDKMLGAAAAGAPSQRAAEPASNTADHWRTIIAQVHQQYDQSSIALRSLGDTQPSKTVRMAHEALEGDLEQHSRQC